MIFGATNKPIYKLLKNTLRYLYSCWSTAKTKYLWGFPVGKTKEFLKEKVEPGSEIKTVSSVFWQTIKIKSPFVITLCILQSCPLSSAAVEKGVSPEVEVRLQTQSVWKSTGVSDEKLHQGPWARSMWSQTSWQPIFS